MLKKITLCLCVLFFITSCAKKAEVEVLDEKKKLVVATYEINAMRINKKNIKAPKGFEIILFDDNTLSYKGCNVGFGSYEKKSDSEISVQIAALTRKMCEKDLMDFENTFVEAFKGEFSIQTSTKIKDKSFIVSFANKNSSFFLHSSGK